MYAVLNKFSEYTEYKCSYQNIHTKIYIPKHTTLHGFLLVFKFVESVSVIVHPEVCP